MDPVIGGGSSKHALMSSSCGGSGSGGVMGNKNDLARFMKSVEMTEYGGENAKLEFLFDESR